MYCKQANSDVAKEEQAGVETSRCGQKFKPNNMSNRRSFFEKKL